MTEVIIPYKPRDLQRSLHKEMRRFNVLVCHRRFGKTVFSINELIKKAAMCPLKDGRFGYVAPYLLQAKDVAWTYLKRFTAPIPGVTYNESELRVDLPNGARIRLYGADNAERLRGLYLDGVVMDEYGQMHPSVWPEIIRPMLTDREGFAIFIGTPMGRNHFCDMYEHATQDGDWLARRYRSSETNIINDVELHNARKSMSVDQYNREFECSFDAAIPGAYYAALLQQADVDNRITRVPYEPRVPVVTSWDLGMDDMTAIWFIQHVGMERHVIDYYENNNEEPPHYAMIVKSKNWAYDCHYLPHDADNRGVLSKRTYVDQLNSLEIGRIQVGVRGNPLDRIAAVRSILPSCWFDRDKTKKGLDGLRAYQTEFDEDKQTFKDHPLHNWASHPADAFGEYATGHRAKPKTKSPQDYPQRRLA